MYDPQKTNPAFPRPVPAYQQPTPRRKGRKWLIALVIVVVVLVGLDFGAKAFAESEMATQLKSHGFPVKPSVSIAGFPFLTQVIARDLSQVTVSSGSFPEGPITITSMRLVVDNVKISSSLKGGTAGPVHGSVNISLGAIGGFLSSAGPLAQLIGGVSGGNGLNVEAVGGNEIKASLDLAGGALSWSATWQAVAAGPGQIDLRLVSSSGLPSSMLSSAGNITVPLSQLPLGLRLTGGLNSSSSGLSVTVGAQSGSFGS